MDSQTSVSNEKNSPSQPAVPGTTSGTQKSTDGKANTAPQELGNKRGFLRKRHIDDPEPRSSCLGENNIFGLEKLSDARPQPRMSDGVVGLIRNRVNEWGNGDFLGNLSEFSQLGRQVRKEPLEADSGVESIQDPGMIRLKLNETVSSTESHI